MRQLVHDYHELGYYPNVYEFSDCPERVLRLEFISTELLQVSNIPRAKSHSSLKFIDVYEYDTVPKSSRLAVGKLVYTSRRNKPDEPFARPFSPAPNIGGVMSVMPFLAGDTVVVASDDDVIVVGGLLFELDKKQFGIGARRAKKAASRQSTK